MYVLLVLNIQWIAVIDKPYTVYKPSYTYKVLYI